jgi:hypothetical protein
MTINRIIWHHTGGNYTPNDTDRAAYHVLIHGDGEVSYGEHRISANAANKKLVPGQYAAHCRNLNSGSIGIAVCAMAGGEWAKPYDRTPVKQEQVAALVAETATLCRLYGITPFRRTVLSHAEVEPTLGVMQRNKWDFDYDPSRVMTLRDPIIIGDALRDAVLKAMGGPANAMPEARPTIRQGDTGEHVAAAQRALGVAADGIFGPRTRSAVVSFQRRRQLLPDGVIGPMTWAALLPS